VSQRKAMIGKNDLTPDSKSPPEPMVCPPQARREVRAMRRLRLRPAASQRGSCLSLGLSPPGTAATVQAKTLLLQFFLIGAGDGKEERAN
jgi:hypothetical protein